MTFNRKLGRDPEQELKKIRKRFRSVTSRVERAELMRKLARYGIRAVIAVAIFAALYLLLLRGLGFRW